MNARMRAGLTFRLCSGERAWIALPIPPHQRNIWMPANAALHIAMQSNIHHHLPALRRLLASVAVCRPRLQLASCRPAPTRLSAVGTTEPTTANRCHSGPHILHEGSVRSRVLEGLPPFLHLPPIH